MKHFASSQFWRAYQKLPTEIQRLADRSYRRLKSNPNHPSLHFKKIGTYWSARVGLHYRALAVEAEADLVWFWIGSHADYDRLIGGAIAHKPLRPTRRRRAKIPTRTRRRTRG